jgi:HSP20 family molecular chaperone IbpA
MGTSEHAGEAPMKTMTKSEKRQNEPDQPVRYVTPRVDITETREGYELRAEMPGVVKSALELVLDGNSLTILGRRPAPPEGLELVYRESSPFDYLRKFELDPAIDTSKVTATMDQGVLRLMLPKAEHVKPRRIQVTD